eukprot:tig00021281_g19916.t1
MASAEHLQILESLRIDPQDGIRQLESVLQAVASGEQDDSEAFVRNVLLKGVPQILKRKDLDYAVSEVLSLLKAVISFIIPRIPADRPDVADLLVRIFYAKHSFYTSSDYNSGMIYGDDYDDDEDMADEITNDDNDLQSAHADAPTLIRAVDDLSDDGEDPPVIFVKLLHYFAKRRGLDAIVQRLNDNQRRVPSCVLRAFITFLFRTNMAYTPEAEVRIVRVARERARALFLSLPDEELKNEDKANLVTAFKYLSDLGDEHTISEDQHAMEAFTLEFALRCFNSPFLEKRLAGLSDFKEIVASVERAEELARSRPKKHQEPSVPLSLPFAFQLLSSRDLSEWFQRNRIVERLFGEGLHIELIRRCGDLLTFFVRKGTFRDREVDLIWNSLAGKHESVWTATLTVLAEVVRECGAPLCESIYRNVAQLPAARYDIPVVNLLGCVTEAAMVAWRVEDDEAAPTYALELLWACVRDDSACSDAVVEHVFRVFMSTFTWDADPNYGTMGAVRERMCRLAVDAVRQSHSVPQALRLLSYAISTYPTKRSKRGAMPAPPDVTQGQVVEQLVHESRLVDSLLADLAIYKQRAGARAAQLLSAQQAAAAAAAAAAAQRPPSAPSIRSTASASPSPREGGPPSFSSSSILPPLAMPSAPASGPPTTGATPPATPAGSGRAPLPLLNLNEERLAGRTPHASAVYQRLTFFDLLIKQASSLAVTAAHVDALWAALVERAVTLEERDQLLAFLTRFVGQNEQFVEDLARHIFHQKACSLSPETLTPAAYEFFEQYLLVVAEQSGVVQRAAAVAGGAAPVLGAGALVSPLLPLNAAPCEALTVTGPAVPGLEALWRAALEAPDPSVGARAIALLRALYSNVAPEQPALLAAKRGEFVHACMKQLAGSAALLEGGAAAGEGAEASARLYQRIDRCLALLKVSRALFIYSFPSS